MDGIGEVIVSFEFVAEVLRAGVVEFLEAVCIDRCGDVTQANEDPVDFVEFLATRFKLVHRMLFADFIVLSFSLWEYQFTHQLTHAIHCDFSESDFEFHNHHCSYAIRTFQTGKAGRALK